jgi:hypothetical protein
MYVCAIAIPTLVRVKCLRYDSFHAPEKPKEITHKGNDPVKEQESASTPFEVEPRNVRA